MSGRYIIECPNCNTRFDIAKHMKAKTPHVRCGRCAKIISLQGKSWWRGEDVPMPKRVK